MLRIRTPETIRRVATKAGAATLLSLAFTASVLAASASATKPGTNVTMNVSLFNTVSSCQFPIDAAWTPVGGQHRVIVGLSDVTTGSAPITASEVVHGNDHTFIPDPELTATQSSGATDSFVIFAVLYDHQGNQIGSGSLYDPNGQVFGGCTLLSA